MVKLVYSPEWFYGKDIIIDIVSVFVLLLIAFFSARYYSITKNKNYLFLALSFALLAASFMFKIFMNVNIYYKIVETKPLGIITATYQTMIASGYLFFSSFLLYRTLTLFAVYFLYLIHHKSSWSNYLLMAYLIFISTYFTYKEYYIFHLTLLIMLVLVTIDYARKYLKQKHFSTKLVAFSFGVIAISQLFFILVDLGSQFYVIGELVQLIGYASLLFTFVTVLRYGRKENKDRNYR